LKKIQIKNNYLFIEEKILKAVKFKNFYQDFTFLKKFIKKKLLRNFLIKLKFFFILNINEKLGLIIIFFIF